MTQSSAPHFRPARLALALCLCACGAAPPGPAPPSPDLDRDEDRNLDTEPAWTGRKVTYGEDFLLSRGEEVSFGDHAPVVGWLGGGERDLRVSVVLQRIPPDSLPGGLTLLPGQPAQVPPCTLLLVRLEPGAPPNATLRVTCGVR